MDRFFVYKTIRFEGKSSRNSTLAFYQDWRRTSKTISYANLASSWIISTSPAWISGEGWNFNSSSWNIHKVACRRNYLRFIRLWSYKAKSISSSSGLISANNGIIWCLEKIRAILLFRRLNSRVSNKTPLRWFYNDSSNKFMEKNLLRSSRVVVRLISISLKTEKNSFPPFKCYSEFQIEPSWQENLKCKTCLLNKLWCAKNIHISAQATWVVYKQKNVSSAENWKVEKTSWNNQTSR